MALNTGKTKFMIFRTRGKFIDDNDCHLVYNSTEIGQETDPMLVSPIERVHNNGLEKSFKLLGVFFDEYLSFDSHVSHLCNKISKTLFSMNRIKKLCEQGCPQKIVLRSCALFYYLLYECLWICKQDNINPSVSQAKKAIRIIAKANYRDHTGPLFADLEI